MLANLNIAPPRLSVVGLFVLGFFGYPLVSFLPDLLGLESRVVSVPFRAVCLAWQLYVIYWLLLREKQYQTFTERHLYFLVRLLYSFRLVYDVATKHLNLPTDQYLLFGLCLGLIGTTAYMLRIQVNEPQEIFKYLYFSLLGIGFFAIIHNFTDFSDSASYRMDGNSSLNTITFGTVSASLALMGLYGWTHGLSSVPRWVFTMGIGVGLLNTVLANSRSPFGGLAIGIVLLVAQSLRKGRGVQLLIFLTIGTVVVVGYLYQRYEDYFQMVFLRFTMFSEGTDMSTDEREIAYRGAIQMFFNNPLLGEGIEERATAFYPHNLILEGFMAMGMGGGLLFLILWLWANFVALRLLFYPKLGWLSLLFFQQSILSLVSGSMAFSTDFWYIMVSVFCFYHQRKRLSAL